MKILTWNINGIRAVREPLGDLFERLQSDIICLQETKVTRDQLDEPSAIVEGFNSYFSFSKVKSGYSGVATFVKDVYTPVAAEVGLTGLHGDGASDTVGCYGDQSEFTEEELLALDNEGRTVITQHNIMDSEGQIQQLVIINVYCPRADPEKEERKTFKLNFYRLLQSRAEALLNSGSHVIILGDVNTSHQKIDHCDPSEDKEFLSNPGRVWLSQLLADLQTEATPVTDPDTEHSRVTETMSRGGGKFLDTFRYFHPAQESAFTCWSTVTGARATNYGVRIDYILGDIALVRAGFSECDIMPEIEGSDHCPVKAALEWEIVKAPKCPAICTKFLPEFTGTQRKLSAFFSRKISKETLVPAEDSGCELSGSQESNPKVRSSKSETQTIKSTISASMKRCRSDASGKSSPSKKLKLDNKKSSKPKQGSLLNFFAPKTEKINQDIATVPKHQKTSENRLTTAEIPEKPSGKPDKNPPEEPLLKPTQTLSKDPVVTPQAPSVESCGGESRKTSVSWKALLKGPPPAPLCKGHQEVCLLRTVKKDSLNKGRQFWVCPRPEGHKTNPEARCEHFVWVDKKRLF